jgi:hypothetical protein
MAEATAIPLAELDPEIEYLVGEGLISAETMGDGGGFAITHAGVREWEDLLDTQKPTEHFLPFVINISGSVGNLQTGAGSTVSVGQSQIVGNSAEIIQILRGLSDLKDAVANSADMTVGLKNDIGQLVTAISDHLGQSEEKRPKAVLRSLLSSLKDLLIATKAGSDLWVSFSPILGDLLSK